MNNSPSLTPEQARRLRALYRSCTEGLLLLPTDRVAKDRLERSTRPIAAPGPRRAGKAPPPTPPPATAGGAR